VKPLGVREWLKKLPLRRKSKQHIRGLMKQLFDWAMLWEIVPIKENPMKLVRITGADEEESEKRVLTPAEFRAILDLLREPWRIMVLVAGCTGLRVSEILGLQWDDLHLERLVLKVRRAVVLGHVGEVKAPKSRSTLPLDSNLAALLLEYRERFAPDARPSDWVFANPARGKPWRPSRIQNRYLRPAGIKVWCEPQK
jgi:integrase